MNTLKWELAKHMYHLRWIVAIHLLLIGILHILPVPDNMVLGDGMFTVLTYSSMLMALTGIYIVLIHPTFATTVDLVRKCGLLEKTHSQPFILTAIAKIMVNVAAVLMGSGLFWLAIETMKKFRTQTSSFLELDLTIPYKNLVVVTAVVLPIAALFAHVVSSSFSPFRRHSTIFAIAIFAMLFAAIMMVQDLPMPAFASVGTQYIIVASAFFLACWLYDNKYEIT